LKRTLGTCKAVPTPEVPDDLQEQIRAGIRNLIEQRAQAAPAPRGETT
jgi:hypothetical protein